ncbi:cytochrome c-550 PedF [Pontivivens ytuae]|uniref:Cytochrome c-550 PedF n=1 Tax=Pontivivens ytuae TaxID=2789856 RepID=A0A7S9QDL4_9RHOB|nr:cytochrome c-550 PedF [Pontivivens ytuae]QPH54261.1 cytochrome c-550 PedF [Pontivivens ytuae]
MARIIRLGALALITSTGLAFAHGDVAPQAVDTSGLPEVGEDWAFENPYRGDPEVYATAIDIGASGYNQNCARCHGLGGVSGGLAPDLRFLEADEFGDEWYVERYRNGYTQNGITRMPAFGELLGQEAAWAIRSYIETRPDDQQITEKTPELRTIRDQLVEWSDGGEADPEAAKAELMAIADEIETLSGADLADSVALRAAQQIDGTEASYAKAAETLTIGLSAAN